jgi:hypothetical protein
MRWTLKKIRELAAMARAPFSSIEIVGWQLAMTSTISAELNHSKRRLKLKLG